MFATATPSGCNIFFSPHFAQKAQPSEQTFPARPTPLIFQPTFRPATSLSACPCSRLSSRLLAM